MKTYFDEKIYLDYRYAKKQTVLTNEESNDFRVQSEIAIPIFKEKDKTLGVLYLASDRLYGFTESQIEGLEILAQFATMVLHKQQNVPPFLNE